MEELNFLQLLFISFQYLETRALFAVITFFPLALGPQQKLLSSLAPGVIWIAALLASLLAVETIFNEDFRDGTLDSFFISCFFIL